MWGWKDLNLINYCTTPKIVLWQCRTIANFYKCMVQMPYFDVKVVEASVGQKGATKTWEEVSQCGVETHDKIEVQQGEQ